MDVERELREVRLRAEQLANTRVRAMKHRLHEEGRADRAVLGIPDPKPFNPLGGLVSAFRDLFRLWL